MLEVNFYEQVADELLKFAVIISKTDGKWGFEGLSSSRYRTQNVYDSKRYCQRYVMSV